MYHVSCRNVRGYHVAESRRIRISAGMPELSHDNGLETIILQS
jgi:hypothetical protein